MAITPSLLEQIHSISNCSMLVVPMATDGAQLLPLLEMMPIEISFLSYAHFPLLNLP